MERRFEGAHLGSLNIFQQIRISKRKSLVNSTNSTRVAQWVLQAQTSSHVGCVGKCRGPPLVAGRSGAPGAWPLAPCLSASALLWLRAFSPPLSAPCPSGLGSCLAATTCAGSQPSSPRSPSSRSPSRLASPGLWAALAPTVPQFLPQPLHLSRRPRLRPQRHCYCEGGPARFAAAALLRASGARSRSRSPAPLPKRAPRRSSSVATVTPRGSVALAESGLVTGLAVKSCPPVSPTQLTRAPQAASCSSRPPDAVPGASARPAGASVVPFPAVESDSDSDCYALLDAHGLTPPPTVAAAAVAQPAVAAGASRRARDKRRRRLRKAAKRSMWREF